jgi:hypothetical protein
MRNFILIANPRTTSTHDNMDNVIKKGAKLYEVPTPENHGLRLLVPHVCVTLDAARAVTSAVFFVPETDVEVVDGSTAA